MSDTTSVDQTIDSLIKRLVEEFSATGIFSTPSAERKREIIEDIAKLRASMEPKIIQNYVQS